MFITYKLYIYKYMYIKICVYTHECTCVLLFEWYILMQPILLLKYATLSHTNTFILSFFF